MRYSKSTQCDNGPRLSSAARGVLGVLVAIATLALPRPASAGNVVISQIYGNGGNGGATLTHDFVELFNRSETPVSIAGWSLQYTSAAGSSWGMQQVNLPAMTLNPGQFFLVRLGTGGGGSTPLPTPDATGSFNISGIAGKVALCNTTTALVGTCPLGSSVVDFVGYGATANCAEGSVAPTNASATTSTLRRNLGQPCQDTDNNAADFIAGASGAYTANPRNTSSSVSVCPLGACCVSYGCTRSSNATCAGTYQGDGTVCAPDPCPASIIDLGTLGGAFSSGLAVSGDGLVVAGIAYNASNQARAFRWEAGVMTDLGVLPGGSTAGAWGINKDGTVLAGESTSSGGNRAFRWTSSEGLQDLGQLAGSATSNGRSISADGSVVVGYVQSPSRAFRWTSADGVQELPRLSGSTIGVGMGVSADGSYGVGFGTNSGASHRALRWLGTGAAQDLGLFAGASETFAYKASADGTVVVGFGYVGFDNRAFRWVSGGSMTSLGTLAGGTTSVAHAVNHDGSVVVGTANVGTNDRAFRWTSAQGLLDLNTYLPTLNVDLTGWTLYDARAVSADGSAIVGIAIHNGAQRAFLARGMPGVERHWVGPVNGLWNSPANWSSTSSGPGGAGVPTFGHNVFVRQGSPTVTFDHTYAVPGIQTLTLEGTIVQSANTMYISGPLIIASGTFDLQAGTLTAASVVNDGSLNVSNGAVLDVSGEISGNYVTYSGTSTMTGGTVTAPLGTSAGTTIIKTTPATLVIDSDLALSSNNTLEVLDGTVVFKRRYGSAGGVYLTINANAAKVRIALNPDGPRSTWTERISVNTPGEFTIEAGTDTVVVTEELSLDISEAHMDLTDNALVLNHSDGDGGVGAYNQVSAYVRAGSAGGDYTGTGILSSVAAATPNFGLGLINNDQGSVGGTPGTPIYPSFRGTATDATSIIVAYVMLGDSDLDGDVDTVDMDRWLTGYQAGLLRGGAGQVWYYGDFDHSEAVDLDDLYLLAKAYYSVNGSMTALLNAIDASTLTPAEKTAARQTICRAIGCVADFNNSCSVTVQDLFDFLAAWFARTPDADVNGSETVTVQDLFDYLSLWFAQCD